MAPVLHYEVVAPPSPEPRRQAIILHGAYGAGHNWGSIARRLVQQRPGWRIILPDLRLHGQSLNFPPPHTLRTAASDIAALTDALGAPTEVIVGHSLGGKVALRYAADHPTALQQVWVVDASPAPEPHAGDAWKMLGTVRQLPASFASRADVVQLLTRAGFTPAVAQWMTSNLVQINGVYRWRLDFDALEELLNDAFAADLWSVVANPAGRSSLHFIKATNSDAIRAETLDRLRNATARRVEVHRLPGGHWINADNPDGVLRLLTQHWPADAPGVPPS